MEYTDPESGKRYEEGYGGCEYCDFLCPDRGCLLLWSSTACEIGSCWKEVT